MFAGSKDAKASRSIAGIRHIGIQAAMNRRVLFPKKAGNLLNYMYSFNEIKKINKGFWSTMKYRGRCWNWSLESPTEISKGRDFD